jgi:hypothetical protein
VIEVKAKDRKKTVRRARRKHELPHNGRSQAINELLVADLGWTALEACEAWARLAAFQPDWDAPGMERYDKL